MSDRKLVGLNSEDASIREPVCIFIRCHKYPEGSGTDAISDLVSTFNPSASFLECFVFVLESLIIPHDDVHVAQPVWQLECLSAR
jgi:hypothetical protein